jgi:hypothetical protein
VTNKLSITHGPNLKKPCFLVSGGEERVSIQYYRPDQAAGSLTQCSFEEAKQLHETLGGFIKKIEELIAPGAAS